MRTTRVTVRETIGPRTKRKVLKLEHIARALEEQASTERNPLCAFGLRHVAGTYRLKALLMRQYPGREVLEAIRAGRALARRLE